MAANERKMGKASAAPASTSYSEVKLGPALTLANAGEVKEALQAALAGDGKISVDATDVAEVDLAGLQLVCATYRAAARAGREVEIASCAALTAAIGALGFGRDVGCGERCLCREVARG